MPKDEYRYIIVGGGQAGAAASEGIRELDTEGAIAIIGDEKSLPYERPPLTKKLWFGKMAYEEIFLHDAAFYAQNGIDLIGGVSVTTIDPTQKTVKDNAGRLFHYEKLLLATGGRPLKISIPGGNLNGICYYRYLTDYQRIRLSAAAGTSAVVIGGGFIGSEIAAALAQNKVRVTMVFPEASLCRRVFPESLSKAMLDYFVKKGITMLHHDKPASISLSSNGFITRTDRGQTILSNMVIIGVGIAPETGLALGANLKIENGIAVNEYLQTSNPDIYAAGDNARFPCKALGKSMRFEHWDNAQSQGKQAGRNMAGARERYDYLPYFFSDLFSFGYEAVGEVDSNFTTFTDWKEENRRGAIYYLKDNKVRGVMLCNIFNKIDAARELIAKNEVITKPERLRGAISFDTRKDAATPMEPAGV